MREMAGKDDIWTKIGNIDRRIYWWILTIVMLVSLVFPLGLPKKISPITRDYYREIMELPSDKVVVFALELGYPSPEEWPMAVATMKTMMSRHLKFVVFSVIEAGTHTSFRQLEVDCNIKSQYVYGVDYVWIGYVVGGEMALSSMASDFKSGAKVDGYGTSLYDYNKLPLMKDINNAGSFGLLILLGGHGGLYQIQWGARYHLAMINGLSGLLLPTMLAYYPDIVHAYICGAQGAAEYEQVSGFLGPASAQLDMLSMAHLVLVTMIVIGNLAYIFERRRKLGGK